MKRRRFLSVAVATPLFAGCSSDLGSDDETPTPSPSASSPSADGPTSEDVPTEDATRTQQTPVATILERSAPPSDADLDTEIRPPAEAPPEATEDTTSPAEYPEKPTTYDAASVEAFVEAHERAYRRNDLLDRSGADLVHYSAFWNWTVTLASDGDAGVGRCQYRYSDTVEYDEDSAVVGDSAPILVTYYVDDSVIVRAETAGRADGRDELVPDPWETGVVLQPGGVIAAVGARWGACPSDGEGRELTLRERIGWGGVRRGRSHCGAVAVGSRVGLKGAAGSTTARPGSTAGSPRPKRAAAAPSRAGRGFQGVRGGGPVIFGTGPA